MHGVPTLAVSKHRYYLPADPKKTVKFSVRFYAAGKSEPFVVLQEDKKNPGRYVDVDVEYGSSPEFRRYCVTNLRDRVEKFKFPAFGSVPRGKARFWA